MQAAMPMLMTRSGNYDNFNIHKKSVMSDRNMMIKIVF